MYIRVLIAVMLLLAPMLGTGLGLQDSNPGLPLARRWIDAVRGHRPGVVDAALLEVSGWGDSEFEKIFGQLQEALERATRSQADRSDVLRRGVLLHTDIALLVPDRAETFARFVERPRGIVWSARPPSASAQSAILVHGLDGQYVGLSRLTAHWAYARMLAEQIRPDPSRDPFVSLWYRATIADFEIHYTLGVASSHVERARKLLPRDPWILFYSGALHEAFASPRFQNIERSTPTSLGAQRGGVSGSREELERAGRYYREAVDVDPSFAEAHLRLGRVLGLLGRHSQALEALQRGLTLTRDAVLRYFADLFAAAEYESLGRLEDARRAYERCASLAPTAQSPLIGLSEVARRSGDRTAALQAMQRLATLSDGPDRIDPWWDYLRSHAWNADQLLEEVRSSLRSGALR